MHTWWIAMLAFELPQSDLDENLVSNCWPKQKVKSEKANWPASRLTSFEAECFICASSLMNMISSPNCLFPQVFLLTIEIFLSQLLRRLVHAVCIFIWLHTNIPVTLMFMWHNNLQTSAPQQVTHSQCSSDLMGWRLHESRIHLLSSESGFYIEPNTLVCRINLLNKQKAHRPCLWTSHCMPWRENVFTFSFLGKVSLLKHRSDSNSSTD